MQPLSKLLEIDNSNLASVLRLGLYGLRTQLQQALKTAAIDPGSSACEELLRELDILLEPTTQVEFLSEEVLSVENNSLWEDVLEPVTGDELNLKHVTDALVGDSELLNYIGEYQFYSTNDADLWNEMQRLLLRVPEKVACAWRSRTLQEVSQVGIQEDRRCLSSLPFIRDELLYPGLTGKVKATGLCLSEEVDFDSRLMVEKRGGELDLLASVVSTCLKFIEQDSCLYHALKSLDRFGVRSLSLDAEKHKYIIALVERFHRVQATADAEPTTALRARLELDEAIHSLVYLPTCDRYSWWGKLQQEARRTLDAVVERARDAGYQVQIRPLWGTYADVFSWSRDDLQLDMGGVRGEVSACLRVYAKINDEVLPGRVLFRSS
ncbi:MAG: hypothetical protein DSM106950_03435 [Stigonema ocellatum SAG 48.90 = DSM 106950]|nr:hypothetical protein [Stigonema ocellatum SAG 48.90 = DSM 106950]